MVVRSSKNKPTQKLESRLVERILGSPFSLDEPYVLQDRTPQTHSRYVVVIWDAWRNMERSERSAIILRALEAANVLEGDTVRMAQGLTQSEAFDSGYLACKIVSTLRNGDPATLDELQAAFDAVGGVHIKIGAAHELRFPSLEHAQEAYRQLTAKLPKHVLAIVQEVSSPDRG